MLTEIKNALRIVNTAFDNELLDLCNAGIHDLKVTGAVFTYTTNNSDIIITDPLAKRAVITYVRCNFGTPDNYVQLKTSYDEQKAQLRMNSDYMEGNNG